MKGVTGLVFGAIVFALLGVGALGAGYLEEDLAAAQREMSTAHYDEAQAALDDAQRYAGYARWVPVVGARVQRDLETRRAAVKYWRGDYEGVLPRETDPVGAVDTANVDLQLVVANAAFRVAQSTPATRPATIQLLDESIGSYLAVLRNDTWHPDAAFNYEYLVRIRDEIARGRRTSLPPERSDTLGEQGAPAQTTSDRKFEIYVPLQGDERTETGEAGKSGSQQKKG